MKYLKITVTVLLLCTLPLLLIESGRVGVGVQRGMELAYRAVLPALFPAMVVCGMIGELAEYLPIPPSWSLFLTSHLCGFPLGVRTVTRAYRRSLLTREQALRLSACCANASPAFVVVYVGEKVLGSTREGLLIYCSQFAVSLAIGLLSGALRPTPTPPPCDRPLIAVLTESLAGAAVGGLTLTGYITFFSIPASLFSHSPVFSVLYGFLELTGGVRGGYLLAAATVGFSGIAVLLQNAAALAEAKLPLWPMAAGKCIYAFGVPLTAFFLRYLTN